MDSVIFELKKLDLFSEPMLSNLVSDYIEMYTVTIEFDLYTNGTRVRKCHTMTLEKFVNINEKTPAKFKNPQFCGFNELNNKLKITFFKTYQNEKTQLFNIDHFGLVPDALVALNFITEKGDNIPKLSHWSFKDW